MSYDPETYATGKDRARVIRRYAHELAGLCRMYVPYLEGKQRRTANHLDTLLHDDPNVWIRRKGVVSTPSQLNHLLQHAQGLQNRDELPEVTTRIRNLVYRINKETVLTRKDPGWAILRMDMADIEPYLQEIRASGQQISASVWGPHISVIRGETEYDPTLWKKYEGTTFNVEIVGELRRNNAGYYWLDVRAPELEAVRTELGLPPRPSPPFHLTIGKLS